MSYAYPFKRFVTGFDYEYIDFAEPAGNVTYATHREICKPAFLWRLIIGWFSNSPPPVGLQSVRNKAPWFMALSYRHCAYTRKEKLT